MNKPFILSVTALATALCASVNAHAQPCNSYTCGTGITIEATNTTSNVGSYGVYATTTGPDSAAVVGSTLGSTSTDSPGVVGESKYANGVVGNSDDANGVSGSTTTTSLSYAGVTGSGPSGVLGTSTLASGGNGVYGQATDGYGVSGYDTSSGIGVIGQSISGDGVYGATAGGNNYGVYGTSSSSSSGDGVVGEVTNGWAGVAGINNASGSW
jgi:hypothetical protein